MNNPAPAGVSIGMKRLLFLLALSGGFSVIWADHRDDDRRREEPRVILYQDADYRGDSLVIYPGEAIDNFSGQTFSNGNGLNDSVSSIRVEGGAEVYVYEDARFRGAAMRLTENVRNLAGRLLSGNSRDSWNDRISSLRVEGRGDRSYRRPPDRDRDRDREIDYDVVIRRTYKDLLGRDPDDGGLRYYRGLMIDQGWTEVMVRDHLRRGDEFRQEGANRIIRRAYLEVLGREVDSGGLNHYRKQILQKDWTEGDVRDDLRRSDEYRNRSNPPDRNR